MKGRFFEALDRVNNVSLNEDERREILLRLLLLPSSIEGIKAFLDFVKNGIPFTIRRGDEVVRKQIFLFDFDDVDNNDFLVVKEFEVEENERRRRFDLCLFVNGIPLVVIETKSPFREEEKGTTWFDAYRDILEYERDVPGVFKYVQFCVVSDGYETRYFPNYYAGDYSGSLWVWKSFYPFSEEEIKPLKVFPYLDSTIFGMLSKGNLLDLVKNFIFVKRYRDTYVKIIARWMQFKAANLIVRRVVEERDKKLDLALARFG